MYYTGPYICSDTVHISIVPVLTETVCVCYSQWCSLLARPPTRPSTRRRTARCWRVIVRPSESSSCTTLMTRNDDGSPSRPTCNTGDMILQTCEPVWGLWCQVACHVAGVIRLVETTHMHTPTLHCPRTTSFIPVELCDQLTYWLIDCFHWLT